MLSGNRNRHWLEYDSVALVAYALGSAGSPPSSACPRALPCSSASRRTADVLGRGGFTPLRPRPSLSLLAFAAVTLAWWGFLAWLTWHVILGQARALTNQRGRRSLRRESTGLVRPFFPQTTNAH